MHCCYDLKHNCHDVPGYERCDGCEEFTKESLLEEHLMDGWFCPYCIEQIEIRLYDECHDSVGHEEAA